ncbi:sigma-70 family RNA polymerase sigma factor [Paenibacillus sp. FSL H7-0756]|uniref:RNA polymerase sigma factor n=1 Tax=unclassified Paenibacillus TaxID=185978 RepID=UPI0030F86875
MLPLHVISTLETEEDKKFISELYLQYYPLMKKKAYEVTYDYNVVDDLINDAFIKLIERIETLSLLEGSKRTTYIAYTIRNISINYIKRRAKKHKYMFLGLSDEMIESISDVNATVEEISTAKETNEEIAKLLEQLSERDRYLLYHKYNLEMSDKEISQVMDIPVNNIRGYLTRARRRALNILKNEGL